MRRMIFACATLICGVGIAAQCFAGPIEDRQQLMKNNLAAVKVLAQMANGEVPYEAALAKQNAETLISDFQKLKDLFPEGSDKGPPETWAKPEIWTDREGFEAARMKALEAAQAAAAITDQAQLGDAVGGLGNACKGCHEKYRTPKS